MFLAKQTVPGPRLQQQHKYNNLFRDKENTWFAYLIFDIFLGIGINNDFKFPVQQKMFPRFEMIKSIHILKQMNPI